MKKHKSRSYSRSRSKSADKQKNRYHDRDHYKNRDNNRHHHNHRDRQHHDRDYKDKNYKNHKDRERDRDHKDRQHRDRQYRDRDRDRDRQHRQHRQYKQKQHRQHRQHSPRNKKKVISSSSSQSRSKSQYSSNSRNNKSRSRSRYSKESKDNSYSQRSRDSYQQKYSKRQQSTLQPRYKIQETKTLKIQNCSQRQAAERALTDASINAGTSVPDQVQLRQGSIFAKYPSVEVSSAIKQLLKQKITINNIEYRVNFYPFKRIDLNIAYDWYCDKCDYKNFARRFKCYRCQNQKNANCKFNYSSTSSSIIPVKSKTNTKEENINNCSLMIRGPIIMQIQEEVLLDLFQAFSAVKDIRMIRNKMTGQLKDFAFVQFFTPQQAAIALKQASSSEFKVKGQKVSVMYSRNKSQDQYLKPLPYEKKQRKRDFPGNPSKKDKKQDQPVQSYYNRQRQLQIEQEKLRPIITIQQLKQKREQQLKKKAANVRELTEQQAKRRQAQMLAKQWEKQVKIQNTVLYICVLCRRKFKGESQMKEHQVNSQLHKYNKQKIELSL